MKNNRVGGDENILAEMVRESNGITKQELRKLRIDTYTKKRRIQPLHTIRQLIKKNLEYIHTAMDSIYKLYWRLAL